MRFCLSLSLSLSLSLPSSLSPQVSALSPQPSALSLQPSQSPFSPGFLTTDLAMTLNTPFVATGPSSFTWSTALALSTAALQPFWTSSGL